MKDFNRRTHIYLIQIIQQNIISLLRLNTFIRLHWVYIHLWSSQKQPENTGKEWHYAVRVYGCILSLPGTRRKRESRKLAKIHVHHKYPANMLLIMHSKDQKVLITRMKNKPEQNTNEGGRSASVSERC